MSANRKKFYLTTSIAYANSAPHIGYALELVQADAIARFKRLSDYEVFFLTGADENGSKIKKTAEAQGLTPQAFVDQNTAQFRALGHALGISNDDFIRTSDTVRHHPAVKKMWQKLAAGGALHQKAYEGLYCVGCETFLSEKDLTDEGLCPLHLKAPEVVKEQNHFFKLSQYLPQIQTLIEEDALKILPAERKNEILNIIKNAIEEKMDVSFSRPHSVLDWGVAVPDDSAQTVYVWCDALTNYLSALDYTEESENFQKFWPADCHLIGKDILRFHAMIWPAMLLAAGLPLPKTIFVHGFITSDGQKMSKSLGNVVDPLELINHYGADAVRYYLLKEIPTGGDGDFSQEKFEAVYKADLQNGLGNLVARVLAMTEKYFDGMVPEVSAEALETVRFAGMELIKKTNAELEENFQNFKLDHILEDILSITQALDGYIQQHEPFKLIKTDPKKTAAVLYNCLETIRVLTWLIRPFMPETSDQILQQLIAENTEHKKHLASRPELAPEIYLKENAVWGPLLNPGTKVKKGAPLFPRLEEKND